MYKFKVLDFESYSIRKWIVVWGSIVEYIL